MRFVKMHALGNDFVVVDCWEQVIDDPSKLASRVCSRHFGIGADGLILALREQTSDARMRFFNADGSEDLMCGNGIRCSAKYVYDHGLSRSNPMRIATDA